MSTTASELAYLSRSLKAPRIAAVSARLAGKAREEGWDYEHYLAAVLAEEVTARDGHGGAARVKAAHFPAVKTVDDFDFTVQTSVSRTTIAHLAGLDFLAEAKNVVFLGPPGTGKTHLSIAFGVQAARRGHRVAFATAQSWVNRLGAAKKAGGWTRSSNAWAGSHFSSWMRWATSRSIRCGRLAENALNGLTSQSDQARIAI
jgi:DNA replication protein DnaC